MAPLGVVLGVVLLSAGLPLLPLFVLPLFVLVPVGEVVGVVPLMKGRVSFY
jgi:hypothetical protein